MRVVKTDRVEERCVVKWPIGTDLVERWTFYNLDSKVGRIVNCKISIGVWSFPWVMTSHGDKRSFK